MASKRGARSISRFADHWFAASIESPASHGARLPPLHSICTSCRRSIQQRRYASAATAAAAVPEETAHESQTPPAPEAADSPQLRPAYQMRAGIVLSRPPMLTRELTPFEKAFYLYQKRLNERLVLGFTPDFYYPEGTPGKEEWDKKIARRITPARDIGGYNAHGKHAWNDEAKVGDEYGEVDHQMEVLLKDAEPPKSGRRQSEADVGETPNVPGGNIGEGTEKSKRVIIEKPYPRRTEADEKNDQTSLNRALERTLYLLVQNEAGRWTFPDAKIVGRESLRQASERIIVEAGGINMNTWVVGNNPIGHFAQNFPQPLDNTEHGLVELGEKVFFMKGRILAGQANLAATKLGLKDFKWLTKDEIKEFVHPRYWSMTQNMLVDR